MNDDSMRLLFDDEMTSIYPILISSIIALIATAVLIWLFLEAVQRIQVDDYSLAALLLILVSGSAFIIYSQMIGEDEDNEL